MKKRKTKATVKCVRGNSYILEEITTGTAFLVDVAVMHEKVIFPSDIIDDDGLIKPFTQVSIVMKRSKSGNIVYLPDFSHYPLKNGDSHDIEKLVAKQLFDMANNLLKTPKNKKYEQNQENQP